MKLFFLTIAAILLYHSTTAQVLQHNTVVGEWTVKNSQLMVEMSLNKEEAQRMESLKKGFIGSKFIFNPDNTFQIKFPNSTSGFTKELEFLNNKKWKLNSKEGLILIGTEKDNYSLMGINVKSQGSKIYFILQDTPFLLEVNKK